jgi:hypothetical protein
MGLEGLAGVEGNADAGELVKAMEEGGIEREAEVGERTQCCGIFGIAGGEHSGGGGGCFGEWLCSLEDGDAEAAAVKFECE